jgi:phosphonopyruvate decarboxylase
VIAAASFCAAARARGLALYSGVPCSYLTPFIDHVLADPALRYVGAADEGSAVAIACGAELGGTGAVAMMQGSGLGNAVNPLTSLAAAFAIPVLLVVTWRGEPGGAPDEPQHALMGAITTRLLELMGIPWEPFPSEDAAIEPALDRAVGAMQRTREPYALVMRKGTVDAGPCVSRADARAPLPPLEPAAWPAARPSRRDLLAAVLRATTPDDVVVATTGYTGRELYALGDRANQLYLVGSMGCASSVGLGLAYAAPSRRIVVVDGDGAALMHLGALATLGHERPPNLVHVLLDNEAHDSTGGQPTVSATTDLAAVARACGYPRVVRAPTADALAGAVAEARGELTMVHAKARPGVSGELPRPRVTPAQVAARIRAHVRGAAS